MPMMPIAVSPYSMSVSARQIFDVVCGSVFHIVLVGLDCQILPTLFVSLCRGYPLYRVVDPTIYLQLYPADSYEVELSHRQYSSRCKLKRFRTVLQRSLSILCRYMYLHLSNVV